MITYRPAMDILAGDRISMPYDGVWVVAEVTISNEHRVTLRCANGKHERSYYRDIADLVAVVEQTPERLA